MATRIFITIIPNLIPARTPESRFSRTRLQLTDAVAGTPRKRQPRVRMPICRVLWKKSVRVELQGVAPVLLAPVEVQVPQYRVRALRDDDFAQGDVLGDDSTDEGGTRKQAQGFLDDALSVLQLGQVFQFDEAVRA
jgi:hypothetical protein